jgi:hypothetical protein
MLRGGSDGHRKVAKWWVQRIDSRRDAGDAGDAGHLHPHTHAHAGAGESMEQGEKSPASHGSPRGGGGGADHRCSLVRSCLNSRRDAPGRHRPPPEPAKDGDHALWEVSRRATVGCADWLSPMAAPDGGPVTLARGLGAGCVGHAAAATITASQSGACP